MKYIDPTGYFFKSIKKAFKKIKKYVKTIVTIAVVAVVTIYTAGTATVAAMSAFWGTVTTGAVAGAVGGVVGSKLNGGTWGDAFKAGFKGAIVGAISAGTAYGIAEAVGSHTASFFNSSTASEWGLAGLKAVAQGVGRAAIAKAQGHKTSASFWSGFAGSAFSVGTKLGGTGAKGFAIRTSIAGTISGTVSQATGGKFANGAVSGAFVHLFNAEAKSMMDFVKHYFSDGSPLSVSSEYFTSDSVQKKVGPFEKNALVMAKSNGSYNESKIVSTDVSFESSYLFSIGDSSKFIMNASCSSGMCNFNYTLMDSFRDPFDIGIGLPFSKPYAIHGRWSKEIPY